MSHEEPTLPTPPSGYTPPPPPSRPLTRDEPPPEKTIFPVIMAVALAGVLVGSWFMQGSNAGVPMAPPVPASTTDALGADAPAPTPTPVASEASPVTAESVKGELDALAKKIDAMPEPTPAVDLKPIQEQIDALSKSVESVAALTKQVEDLSAKLAESEKTIEAMKAELSTTKDEMAARIAAMPAPSSTSAPAASPAVDAAALTSAVDLFKANRFAEALDAFKKLPANDARVLYYTALATGLNTRSWTGETEKVVLQGVDREKAGSPTTAEIDAALAGLTEQQGKAWLAFYRAKAK